MPLSEEDRKEIASLFAEMVPSITESFVSKLEENNESIRAELTKQVGGVMARTKSAIAASSASTKKEIEDGLESSLGKLIPVDDKTEESSSGPKLIAIEQIASKQPSDSDSVLNRLANQVKAQSAMMAEMQQKYQESEAARRASEESAMRSQLESGFISKVSDKVVDPQTFLQTLVAQGKIVEKDGAFVVKTGNLTLEGTEEFVSAESQIDTFLNNGLGYFAKPRPGAGLGAEAAGISTVSSGNIYVKDDVSADDLLVAMKSGKEDEIMKEISKARS